jgi:hypothetical protein
MPENIPKTVAILIWLLTGVIIFGWLLMARPTGYSFLFALLFFGIPVLASKLLARKKSQDV